MKSNLQLVFSPQRCYINKPGTDKLVTLVENGPLYYLPTQGRTTASNSTSSTSTAQTQPTTTTTSTSLQLDKTDLYNTYIAPLEQQQEPRPTSWTDYWLLKPNCLVRVHKSARRKLFTPTDAELPTYTSFDQLDGRRITHVKDYKTSPTLVHVDNFLTAQANFRPTDGSWSGYTVFPLKQPTPVSRRLSMKQPPRQPLQPEDNFNFSPDELLRQPPGLERRQDDNNNDDTWTETATQWIRTHKTPRQALFTPTGTRNGPQRDTLTNSRKTEAYYTEGKQRLYGFTDDWTGDDAHKLLPHTWTGTTTFTKTTGPPTRSTQLEPTEPMSVDSDPPTVPTDVLPQPEPSLEARKAKGYPTPYTPTETERQLHNLTHLPYRDWCTHCVNGKGKEAQHRKLGNDRTPTVQLDYQFITQPKRQLAQDEQPDANNSHIVTVLVAVDTLSGLALEAQVNSKGADKLAETELCKFLIEIGRTNCILLGDNEPSLINLMKRVVKKLGTSATYRTTPNYSPASKGNCERRHSITLGQLKTIKSDLCQRFGLKELDIRHPLFTWLIKHTSFTVNRYLIHSDGKTSYCRRWDKEYSSPLCNFGETVHFRNPRKLPNSQTNWDIGTWLGRCTINNEVLIATSTGEVVRARTIKRLPLAEQANKELLLSLKGTPLQPNGTTEEPNFLLSPEMVTSFAFATGSQKYPEEDSTGPADPPDPVGAPTSDDYRNIDEHLRSSTASSSSQPQQESMDLDPSTDEPMTEPATSRATRPRDDDTEERKPTRRRLTINNIITFIHMVGTVKGLSKEPTSKQILLNEDVTEAKWHTGYFDELGEEIDYDLVLQGMETEATSIDSFDVYETAPLEQATGKILSSKWVHRLKETICKSRIVVRGFEQLWTEALTSSPTP
jgi:hypothetical protein